VQLNQGQTGGTVGYDINVVPVWRKGITGRGIVVSILDDGIDHTHPDLQHNYVRVFHMHFDTEFCSDQVMIVRSSFSSSGSAWSYNDHMLFYTRRSRHVAASLLGF